MEDNTHRGWGKFKQKYPRIAKGLKVSGWIISSAVVATGAACVTYVFGNNPKKGNDNSRAHFRKDGKCKVAYKTKEEANLQVIKDACSYGTIMTPYKCSQCDAYHLGHKSKRV